MVDDNKFARNLHVELDDDSTTGGHERGLHIVVDGGPPFDHHGVKDFSDHMEGADQIGPAIADEQTYGFAFISMQRVVAGQRTHGTVEYDIVRVFLKSFAHIERLETRVTE